MKKCTLFIGFLLLSYASFAQNAQKILEDAYAKCQSIQNGYLESTTYFKGMSGNDTTVNFYTSYFKKLKNDSIFASAFHTKDYYNGKYTRDVIYSGNEFVRYSEKDSAGTIMEKSKWADEIIAIRHNYKNYLPLTDPKNWLFSRDSSLSNPGKTYKLLEEEKVNDVLCYHIRADKSFEFDSTELINVVNGVLHFWIDKKTMIPLQYSTTLELLMGNETVYQYEKNVLNKYTINNLEDESVLQLASIPSFCKITAYKLYERPELLPDGSPAPDWNLLSLEDKKVGLSDLKGHLVLVDFFYKACYPCMKALPALQSLHEKHKDKGLVVVGIDPYDSTQDDLGSFLAKRGVAYTILYGNSDVAKSYNLFAYPTIYLIGKDGKIIYSQAGYGETTESILEEIIKKNL